ncbi:MAG: porin family protein, partial [Candidatus Neomarinimicrobiota bacterium]
MVLPKSLLCASTFIFLAASLAIGQGLSGYGAKAGLNLANISGDDVTEDKMGAETSMNLGFAVGGYATFDLGLPVLIQPEVMFSQKGYRSKLGENFGEYAAAQKDVVLNYININPLAIYSINEKSEVFAGPSLGLFLNGKQKILMTQNGEPVFPDVDIKSENMNGMDIALVLGVGYTLILPLGDINVEARYSLGLKKAWDEDLEWKNNVIQIIV